MIQLLVLPSHPTAMLFLQKTKLIFGSSMLVFCSKFQTMPVLRRHMFTLTRGWPSVVRCISGFSINSPYTAILPAHCYLNCHYSIKRKDYSFPQLKEDDLEEEFVRGSGPGGQSVNKTSNCVVLKHIPTGMVVKCHETRSLHENRKRARIRLQEKIDFELHGEQSFLGRIKSEGEESKKERKRRTKKRLALKASFREKEGLT